MIILMSTVEIDESALPSVVAQQKLSRYSVDFITSMRATTVSLGIYPPGSKTIANAVEKVSKNLQNLLEMQSSITFSEINGLLLIDGKQLDERDRKKAPIVDFIASMIERNIQSITFKKNTTSEELVDFLVIISKKSKEIQEIGPIPEQMETKKVKNIQLNERIYVASTQEEEEERNKREMLLAKMLMDQYGEEELDSEAIGEMLQDQEQFTDVLKVLVKDEQEATEMSRKEYVSVKSTQISQMLVRAATILGTISEEEQRNTFLEGMAQMVADLDPEVVGKLLLDEQMNPTKMSELGIEGMVFNRLGKEKALRMTDYVIGEIEKLRRTIDQYPPEERKTRVKAVKEMVKMVINETMQRDYFGQITEKLQKAGLVKEQMAEQLASQAQVAQEGAEISTISLLNSDGTVNEESLEKTIRLFEKVSDDALPGVVSGLTEILGEVVFHEEVGTLVKKALARLDQEKNYSLVYTSLVDFLGRMCKELIFNESYEIALDILKVFNDHARPDTERHHEQKKRSQEIIQTIASDDVNRMLLTVYQHGDEEAREKVGGLIVRMGQRMLFALVDVLKNTEDRRIRRQIMNLLKNTGKDVLEMVRGELNNLANPWYVARNMVMLLAEVGSEEEAKWLHPLLSHEDPRVRREVAKTLSLLDPKESLELIRSMMGDRDQSVKRLIITTLGNLGDKESIPTLVDLVRKRNIAQAEVDDAIQLDAVAALGKMGDSSVVPILLEVLKKEGVFSKSRTKPPEVRARACFSLAAFPLPEVAKAIKSATKDGNTAVSEAARMVLPRVQS